MSQPKLPCLYIAGPYSHSQRLVRECRERELTRVAHMFLSLGTSVFSPITHSAPFERLGLPNDHDFWVRADAPFVEACSHLVIVRMAGWEDSHGVIHELRQFLAAGKPICWLRGGAIIEECEHILSLTKLNGGLPNDVNS